MDILAYCWGIIKEDLVAAINQFFNLNQQQLHLLNQAFVVLIPKKNNPTMVSDYRPISLVHSFTKIVSKLLANRLAPELPNLISMNQSAFIKKRSICATGHPRATKKENTGSFHKTGYLQSIWHSQLALFIGDHDILWIWAQMEKLDS